MHRWGSRLWTGLWTLSQRSASKRQSVGRGCKEHGGRFLEDGIRFVIRADASWMWVWAATTAAARRSNSFSWLASLVPGSEMARIKWRNLPVRNSRYASHLPPVTCARRLSPVWNEGVTTERHARAGLRGDWGCLLTLGSGTSRCPAFLSEVVSVQWLGWSGRFLGAPLPPRGAIGGLDFRGDPWRRHEDRGFLPRARRHKLDPASFYSVPFQKRHRVALKKSART